MWNRMWRRASEARCPGRCIRSYKSIGGIGRRRSGANELETAAIYRVEELRNGLRIKGHKRLELWERLILTFGLAVFVGTVSFILLGLWSIILNLATAIPDIPSHTST